MSAGQAKAGDRLLSIRGRLDRCIAASKLDQAVDAKTLQLAKGMFYAGFAAALEANMEIAELDEASAMRCFAALELETQTVAAMLQQALAGARPN